MGTSPSPKMSGLRWKPGDRSGSLVLSESAAVFARSRTFPIPVGDGNTSVWPALEPGRESCSWGKLSDRHVEFGDMFLGRMLPWLTGRLVPWLLGLDWTFPRRVLEHAEVGDDADASSMDSGKGSICSERFNAPSDGPPGMCMKPAHIFPGTLEAWAYEMRFMSQPEA